MRMLWLAIAIIVAPLNVPGSAQAASVHREFSQIWEGRLAAYNNQWESADKQAREIWTKFFAALPSNPPTMGADLTVALDASYSTAMLVGRRYMLDQLQKYMKKKPSAAAAEAWSQGVADEMRTDNNTVEAKDQAYKALQIGGTVTVIDKLVAFEEVVTMRGSMAGRVAELQLIEQNLGSYYQAWTQEQKARREARANFLRAFGAALMAQQQQATRPSTMTCMPMMGSNMTTCTSH